MLDPFDALSHESESRLEASLNIPNSETRRQAVHALRGYIYQIFQSLMAWSNLRESEVLYLEVAEDFAVVSDDALRAVQVKDTANSGPVTLNTESVRAAIQSLWDLRQANPNKLVRLRYLTTAAIGFERHRLPGNSKGLDYWRSATTSRVDVEPLRKILSEFAFSDELKTFVQTASDAEFRENLLVLIDWDCGEGPTGELVEQIEERLVYLGEQHAWGPSECRPVRDLLLYVLLRTIAKQGERKLTRASFLEYCQAASSITVPISALRHLLLRATSAGNENSAEVDVGRDQEIERISESSLPATMAPRQQLVAELLRNLGITGVLWIHGSSGVGKTILAQLIACNAQHLWLRVDFRSTSGPDILQRLRKATRQLNSSGAKGLILDDFPIEHNAATRRGLADLLICIRRNNSSLIVTAARSPSPTLREWLGEISEQKVPYLTSEEVAQLVSANSGDATLWAMVVHNFSGFGHPQLVAARISGLRRRSWPITELLAGVDPTVGPSSEIEDERADVRRRLIGELSEEARELLYRLALCADFDRPLALAIAQAEPSLPRPGELLELLVGPWIERPSDKLFRVSPLLSNGGTETLTSSQQRLVHVRVVESLLERKPFPARFLGHLFTHALIARHEKGLFWLAGAVTQLQENRTTAVESLFLLSYLNLDRPIFPEDLVVSTMLRLAQYKVTIALNTPEIDVRALIERIMLEAHSIEDPNQSQLMLLMVIPSILIERPRAISPRTWVPLLTELSELLEDKNGVAAMMREIYDDTGNLHGCSFTQALFVHFATALRSIDDLKDLLEQLAILSPGQRDGFLTALQQPEIGVSLLVSSAWLAEHEKGPIDGNKAAAQFAQLIDIADGWKNQELTTELHYTQAVMLDEYARNSDDALSVIDKAALKFPGEYKFARQRAKIHYRRGDYEAALSSASAEEQNLSSMPLVARAFFLRETGICAAQTGRLDEASRLFARAQQVARECSPEMLPMAVGLLADQAVVEHKLDRRESALVLMAQALREGEHIDPTAGLREIWCMPLLTYATSWLYGQTLAENGAGDAPTISFGCCSNPEPASETKLQKAIDPVANWYRLAGYELVVGVDHGVLSELRQRTTNGVMVNLEMYLEIQILARAIQRGQIDRFLLALARSVDVLEYSLRHKEALAEQGFRSAPIHKIPSVVPTSSMNIDALDWARNAVLTFAAHALATGQNQLLAEFAISLRNLNGWGDLLIPMLECLANGYFRNREWQNVAAFHVAVLHDRDRRLIPRDLFALTCSPWNWLTRCPFNNLVDVLFADTLATRWAYVAEHQRFALNRPKDSVPAIKSALATPKIGRVKIAAIILAAEAAVGEQVSSEMGVALRTCVASLERSAAAIL